MPRALRMEYPGAIYPVLNRGDRREEIFKDEQDRKRFLETLGEAWRKTDGQIHACCLMGNHFPLAEHLHRGTWTQVANRLAQNLAQPDNQPDLNLCQK